MSAFSLADLESAAEVQGDNKVLLDVGLSSVFLCGAAHRRFYCHDRDQPRDREQDDPTIVQQAGSRDSSSSSESLSASQARSSSPTTIMWSSSCWPRHGVMSTGGRRDP